MHLFVTSLWPTKNLALHPPQLSKAHLALGKLGHLAVWHGLIKQFTGGTPGGHGRRREGGDPVTRPAVSGLKNTLNISF